MYLRTIITRIAHSNNLKIFVTEVVAGLLIILVLLKMVLRVYCNNKIYPEEFLLLNRTYAIRHEIMCNKYCDLNLNFEQSNV